MIWDVFRDYFYNVRFAEGFLIADIFRSQRRFTQQGKSFNEINVLSSIERALARVNKS